MLSIIGSQQRASSLRLSSTEERFALITIKGSQKLLLDLGADHTVGAYGCHKYMQRWDDAATARPTA